MAKLLRLLLIAFLLGLLSFVMVPVEYIHSLYNHTDTADCYENNQTPALDNSHHHCLILKIEFREFLINSKLQVLQVNLSQGFLSNYYISPFLSYNYSYQEQRGPPA